MLFRLSRLRASGQGGFPTQPRKLKRWLEELPLVNMGEATRQYYEGLKLLNASELSAAHRLELLELMRPMGNTVLDHLGRHFINRTLPLPEKSRRIAALNRAVSTELAAGYTRTVHELLAMVRPREKELALAIYRAMRLWGDIVLNSWRLYEAPPPGTWRELYRLYRAAETHGIEERAVMDDSLKGHNQGTISRIFKATCLLALAHPLSLRQGETPRVAEFLAGASGSAVISRDLMADTGNGIHVADLESDEPPTYHKLEEVSQSPGIRGINTAPLVREIREKLQAPGRPGACDMSADLLGRVLDGLTRKARRRFSRATRDDEINVAISLTGIHATIARELSERLSPGERTLGIDHLSLQTIDDDHAHNGREASFLSPSDALGDAQAWDMVGRGNVITEGYRPAGSSITAVGIRSNEIETDAWQLVNASAGGFCLRWPHQETSRAQVGELIGLREKEGSHYQWRVGVIRWMLNKSNRGLEIGVQVLAPKTLLVHLKPSRMGQPVGDTVEALMLPAIKTIQQPPTLLTPPGRFRVGDEAVLTLANRSMRIKLAGVCEHTSLFAQHRYAALGRNTPTAQPEEDRDRVNRDGDRQFDDVWTLI